MNRPYWWSWDLVFTPHVIARGEERGFTEIELRRMLEEPATIRHNPVPGRWTVGALLGGGRWEIIVEPDVHERVLVVVTAYRLRRP